MPDKLSSGARANAAPRRDAKWQRSWLFVPGTRTDRFAKALASGAHAVILDLEDAVPEAEKDAAREAVANWLAPTQPVFVRINAANTPHFEQDLRICALEGVAGIVLPKAETPDDVVRVASAGKQQVAILPLVESALGLWNARAIGEVAGVSRLVFGSIDFQLDLGVTDGDLLSYRAQLVLASRVAGIAAPVDGVTTAIDDPGLLQRDAERARQLGFGGKLCIHPKQVAIVNAAFAPTPAEIAWAQRVVAANAQAGGAAIAVDGNMVDRPVLQKARAILAQVRSGSATGEK